MNMKKKALVAAIGTSLGLTVAANTAQAVALDSLVITGGTFIPGLDFTDVWDRNPLKFFNPDGFTCCQLEDLSNISSELDERIDMIFVNDTSFLPLVFVTGEVPIFPLNLLPNWASDHGGVFAKLIFK